MERWRTQWSRRQRRTKRGWPRLSRRRPLRLRFRGRCRSLLRRYRPGLVVGALRRPLLIALGWNVVIFNLVIVKIKFVIFRVVRDGHGGVDAPLGSHLGSRLEVYAEFFLDS